MEDSPNTHIVPTHDHEQSPGYQLCTAIGGKSGGQTFMAHIEQADHEIDGERYHRIDAYRFASEGLLRGAWGRG
ncbi:hypothetical protein [Algisphaera agarilytica]|uniref:Uncharacterized protein n=1 Tax=Algisphaera agarilytica TaxID=1385975 RepID=A0A7X0LLL4_9BACT|nr:hypothetical protein [Algisphaera agarilytica]MBB6431132.1 hypothetical protein [Algisphaera agarilytica]